ncbi:response regulator transcription factor [Kocuria sp. CPCC 205258]|jgi:DNA-binding NarL/FixJ family response regulator|uniref:response regulator n=1 Tax=Kocuria sp. CPCC 205258 TaxID=3073552 RepID=UPI0034D40F61
MSLRVLLADDQELVRTGLRTLCEIDGDITVVAEAANGHQAVSLTRQHRPDVVLMDIRMPGADGLAATRRILADPAPGTGPRVLMLTTYGSEEYLFEALRSGASGFLTKDVDPAELRRAIRTVAAGEALLTPQATRSLIEAFVTRAPHDPDPARLAVLTDREREVLGHVGRGLSNIEIGRLLLLSPATVKTHVNRAMTKLDARDRAQLVVIAYETGLVRPGDAGTPTNQ